MNRLIAVFVVAAALGAPTARAAILVVNNGSPVASDSNDGSEAAPLLTIQAAVDRASPGDTIRVKAGVYGERVVLRTGGLPGLPLSIEGEPGAVLLGGDVAPTPDAGPWDTYGISNTEIDPWGSWIGQYVVDFVRIAGLEIANYWNGVRGDVAAYDEATGAFLGAEGWTVENCVIHGGHEGISIWNGSTPERGSVVRGNLVYDQSWTDIHTHRFTVVERNVALSHASEENIRSCSAYELEGSIQRVVNNTALNGTYGILVEYPNGVYENNVVSSTQRTATDYWSGTTWEEGGFAFRLPTWRVFDLETDTISYNDIWANPFASIGDMNYGTYPPTRTPAALPAGATGNFDADPLFVVGTRAPDGDYHLTAGSPCVDAGDPATPVPPGGGARVDVGAFELGTDVATLIALKHSLYDAGQIDNRGIVVALDAKLAAAKASLVRGQLKTARNQVSAMINQTNAQAGKHITRGAATALVQEARAVQRSIDARLGLTPTF